MSLYPEKALLYLRALTPVHVGTGRAYAAHVDLPVQRDEYGYPSIWASSLKGALKANIGNEAVEKCFGPEPDKLVEAVVGEYAQSNVVVTDAKLILMPARVLRGIYTYVTSLHLLGYLGRYLEMKDGTKLKIDEDLLRDLKEGYAIASKKELIEGERIVVNETTLRARFREDLLEKLKLGKSLPVEVYNDFLEKGLVVIPDVNNTSLYIVNKSMFIQHRVRLDRKTKTVGGGPWSEEYVPSNTVFASLILCRGREIVVKTDSGEQKVKCTLDLVKKYVETQMSVVFVGGKETVGRGLVKLYLM